MLRAVGMTKRKGSSDPIRRYIRGIPYLERLSRLYSWQRNFAKRRRFLSGKNRKMRKQMQSEKMEGIGRILGLGREMVEQWLSRLEH